MAIKVINADQSAKIRETFSIASTADNVVVHYFDNQSNPDLIHDQIDLTSIFDSLGGVYRDGTNDLQDRVSAVALSYGDYDGDGKSDDVRMTIKGDNFKVDFIDPVSPWKGSFDIGSGKGVYDDIAVMKTASVTPTPIPQPIPSPVTSDEYLGKYPAHWARLSNGINVERSELGKVSAADFKYLHDIGVQNVRVFLHPPEYLTFGQAMNPDSNGWIKNLKSFMDRATDAGIAVVVTPFAQEKAGYMYNPNDIASVNQYVSWMKEFAGWVNRNYDPQDVFIETRNEPRVETSASDYQDAVSWWNIQEKLVDAIHDVAPDFTAVASATKWSSWQDLVGMKAYDDPNVVYSVHYYQPMSFTHQGSSWIGWTDGLTNVQWPGAEGKTVDGVKADFAKVKAWADAQDAFIWLGEFGVTTKAPAGDRAQWYEDLREVFDGYGWGWDVWDYNKAFSITNTDAYGNETVQDAILKALDWGKYSTADSPWEALLAGLPTGSTGGSTPSPSTAPIAPLAPSSSAKTTFNADSAFAVAESFTLTSDHLNKTVAISNFDTHSGSPAGIKDQVDISAIFDALGIEGMAARKAALNLNVLDLNGDGIKDAQLTVDGASGFTLDFLNPNNASVGAFDIGDGHGTYDNIVIA